MRSMMPGCLAVLLILSAGGCSRDKSGNAPGEGGRARATPASPRESVAAALRVEGEAADAIYRLLESAVWKQCGAPVSEGHRETMAAMAKQAREKKEIKPDMMRKMMRESQERTDAEKQRNADDAAKGIVHLPPAESLQKAFERLAVARPDLDEYNARKAIVAAVNQAWPHARGRLSFAPRLSLFPPDPLPPPPAVGNRYAHFLKLTANYWDDKVFAELLKLPPDKLPDEAMIPCLHLTTIGDQALRRDGYDDLTYDKLLTGYGQRLYPALVEYLGKPHAYGRTDTSPPVHLLRIAATWTADVRLSLLDAALRSGWNAAVSILAVGEERSACIERFKDSPYGAPR